MEINQKVLEKIIIKSIINDSTFMSRVVKHLNVDLFSNTSYNVVATFYKQFWEAHSKLPSVDEIKLFATDTNFFNAFKTVINETSSIDLASIDKSIIYTNSEKFIKEKLALYTLTKIVDRIGKSEIDPSQLVNKFEEIAGVSLLFDSGYNIHTDLQRFVNSLKFSQNKLPTGFKEIDKYTNGGVLANGKCLAIVTAPTNMGKSIMLGNIATNVAKMGKNVLIISLEMAEEVYAGRIYSALYDLPINSLPFITDELKAKVEHKNYGDIIIKEFPPATMTVEQIDGYIDDLIKAGHKFDLVCIDYLTLFNAPGADNSNEAGKMITRKLRALTYKYNIPFWTACQINRDGMKEKTQELSHIAESIAIAAEADLIISLNQQPEDKEMNIMRCTFLKSRLGGNGFTVNLYFNQVNLRFEDMGDSKSNDISEDDKNTIAAIENALNLNEIIENAS